METCVFFYVFSFKKHVFVRFPIWFFLNERRFLLLSKESISQSCLHLGPPLVLSHLAPVQLDQAGQGDITNGVGQRENISSIHGRNNLLQSLPSCTGLSDPGWCQTDQRQPSSWPATMTPSATFELVDEVDQHCLDSLRICLFPNDLTWRGLLEVQHRLIEHWGSASDCDRGWSRPGSGRSRPRRGRCWPRRRSGTTLVHEFHPSPYLVKKSLLMATERALQS